MRICLDLDGVICEYNFPLLVRNFFGVDISPVMIFAYDLADVLGVAPTLINTMFQEQVYGKPNFIPGSIETLTEWKSKGYELIIYSNRIKYMGYKGLAEWLIEYQIPFSGIDGGQGSYDAHIDDSPSKLMETDSKIKLLYTQPWNTRCHNITGKLKRVNNWQEVRDYV
jgi:5'(3')-deoxyribonucleotidase